MKNEKGKHVLLSGYDYDDRYGRVHRGAFLICEMFAYYKSQGIGLWEKLQELYAEYGYCLNTLHSYTFEGAAGFTKMQEIVTSLRGPVKEFGGKAVETCLDYAEGLDGLPKSNVLKFLLEDHCSVDIRPSGTEPKMKAYISVSASDADEAGLVEAVIVADLAGYFA